MPTTPSWRPEDTLGIFEATTFKPSPTPSGLEKGAERVENGRQAHIVADTSELVKWMPLCKQIMAFVPYRFTDGVNPRLFEHAQLWMQMGIHVSMFMDPFCGEIEIQRNRMVNDFLQDPEHRQWLLMVDNDVVPPLSAPWGLARHNAPIVSGVACGVRGDLGAFACFAVPDAKGQLRFPSTNNTKVMPAKGLIPVQRVGAGCLLMRRDILEALNAIEPPFMIPAPERLESNRKGEPVTSEDLAFCIKARKMGFPIFVDPEIQCGHAKTLVVGWTMGGELDPNLDPKDWFPSEEDKPCL